MNNNQLKKAIELSKKTGDRLMVYDLNTSDDAFIVMAIDDYEKIALGEKNHPSSNLTDDELTDKINRDIVSWKESQVTEKEDMLDDENSQEAELTYDYKQKKKEGDKGEKKEHWSIPKSRRNN